MRKVLITLIVIIALILTAMIGFIVYDSTHVFVDGEAYFKFADTLDLREKEVSESHYLQVKNQFPGAEIIWNVPFQGGALSSDATEITITELAAEDVRILSSYFPMLQTIQAQNCGEYALLSELAYRLPECKVNYQIDLGGAAVDPKAAEATLETGSYDFDTMMTNLVYLSQLKSLHLPEADLNAAQLEELSAAYPDVSITCTVEILGREYDTSTTVLDLSTMTSADVEKVAAKLGMLPALSEVQLMNTTNGSNLTLEDVNILSEAAPGVLLRYSFDFYGVPISTSDEEVVIKGITVDDDRFEEKLRLTLSVLENCERFVLDCRGQYDKLWEHIDNATLAELRDEFRDRTKLVWRVFFGDGGSSLTDAEVIRAVYGLTDDNSKDLIYCENTRYLDVGHNEFLDYMEFLSGMKDLEVAILSGAPLKDLSPVAACKNLKFLEIANCIYLPDINALKECTQLEMLNISFTRFEDMSVLNDLNLTHLTTVQNAFVSRNEPSEDLQAFIDAHPDCWTVYEGEQPYGVGWRYDDEDNHLEWYAKMVKAFKYPNPYNNIGWYLGEDFE